MSESAGAALVTLIDETRDDAELVAEVYAAKARAQREALDWAERATRAEAYAQQLEAKLRRLEAVTVADARAALWDTLHAWLGDVADLAAGRRVHNPIGMAEVNRAIDDLETAVRTEVGRA